MEVLANPAFCIQNITTQELLPKVSLASLKLAIEWVEFLEKHARNLLLDSPSEASPSALLAEKILQKFKASKWQNGATERSIKRLFRAKNDGQYFDDAMELLEEFGWIRFEQRMPKKGGTASKCVRVNPYVLSENDDVPNGGSNTLDKISDKNSVPNVPTDVALVANTGNSTYISSTLNNTTATIVDVPTGVANVPTVVAENSVKSVKTVDNTTLIQNVPDGVANGTDAVALVADNNSEP